MDLTQILVDGWKTKNSQNKKVVCFKYTVMVGICKEYDRLDPRKTNSTGKT